MAKQTPQIKDRKKIHRLASGILPTVSLQSDVTQEHINIWLRRSRHDRGYPGFQELMDERAAKYWQGQAPSAQYVMRLW